MKTVIPFVVYSFFFQFAVINILTGEVEVRMAKASKVRNPVNCAAASLGMLMLNLLNDAYK